MKQQRKKSPYRVPNGNIYSYYTEPYIQSDQSYNSAHGGILKGHKTPNGSLYNGEVWAKNTVEFSSTNEGNAVDKFSSKIQKLERVRKWSREDALKAIKFEEELCKRRSNAPFLIIRFPDPPLNSQTVKGFSNDIDGVYFQTNSSPRFCYVRLKANADAAKVIEDISKIPFGLGYLSAELRVDMREPLNTKPEFVDPYTICVGNLSLSVTVDRLKQHFPGALGYDLAIELIQKDVRYAFIRFDTVKKAIEAFKNGLNLRIDGRAPVLSFRRAKLNIPEIINLVESEVNNTDSRVENNYDFLEIEGTNPLTKTATNDPVVSVVDLSAEDMNIVRSNSTTCQSTQFYRSDCVKSEVLDEDSSMSNPMKQIKEETYDSEYSSEDECSNSYLNDFNDNLENTNIKSEVNDLVQISSNSNGCSIFESNVDHDFGECCRKSTTFNKNYHIPYRKKINITTNFGHAETRTTTSSSVSLSEKKYIENLYDQLNSSKVFKKEVRSDFDELEEMLKEVD